MSSTSITQKITQKGSYSSLNTLVGTNSLIKKVLIRSFIIVNVIMEIESTHFTDIFIFCLK